MSNQEGRQVMLLSDSSPEESQDALKATAQLLQAAEENRIVAVVCTHKETAEEGVILCASFDDEASQTSTYVPLGLLFTKGNATWTDYDPPSSAVVPADPMDVFEEDEDGEAESESEEAS